MPSELVFSGGSAVAVSKLESSAGLGRRPDWEPKANCGAQCIESAGITHRRFGHAFWWWWAPVRAMWMSPELTSLARTGEFLVASS